MKKKIAGFIRALIFLSILCISLYYINQILLPKNLYQNSSWPTTSSYHQFYEMEEDSIDVLFLGSSVVVNAFAPQELYNNYGITGFNLGSEEQSILLSYFWLKEALRFQSPKAVVLDTRYLFTQHVADPVNTAEPMIRKCIDPMKWSSVKMEAVRDICSIDERQSLASYYLTNIRFHERWTELDEYDLQLGKSKSAQLLGFGPLTTYGSDSYDAFILCDTESTVDMDEIMRIYLDKMVALCQENGIDLILLSLPGNTMYDGVHNCLQNYAREHEIAYLNLCEMNHYNQIGAQLPLENVVNHGNIWGAVKLTNYIGAFLQSEYALESHTDVQWENTNDYYMQVVKDCNLTRTYNLEEYLNKINDPNYTIYMATRDEGVPVLSDSVKMYLANLGIVNDFTEGAGNSYYAVISPGKDIIEETGEEKIYVKGSLPDTDVIYEITSGGWKSNITSSIVLNGTDYSRDCGGMHFVVYDNIRQMVVDSVCFNWLSEEMNAIR